MARRTTEQGAVVPNIGLRNLVAAVSLVVATSLVVPGFVVVVAIGMIPSLVARLLDRGQQRYKSICVSMANWSGVFPYVIDVFGGASSFVAAREILASPMPYVVMWGCAALGYLIFTTIPPIVATVLTAMAQRKIAALRSTQRLLIEEWGDDVSKPGGAG